jgi:hypothetical protein
MPPRWVDDTKARIRDICKHALQQEPIGTYRFEADVVSSRALNVRVYAEGNPVPAIYHIDIVGPVR